MYGNELNTITFWALGSQILSRELSPSILSVFLESCIIEYVYIVSLWYFTVQFALLIQTGVCSHKFVEELLVRCIWKGLNNSIISET